MGMHSSTRFSPPESLPLLDSAHYWIASRKALKRPAARVWYLLRTQALIQCFQSPSPACTATQAGRGRGRCTLIYKRLGRGHHGTNTRNKPLTPQMSNCFLLSIILIHILIPITPSKSSIVLPLPINTLHLTESLCLLPARQLGDQRRRQE
jgi:hypothetical protein